MAGEHSRGEEEEWEMVSLRGLHGLKQGLPKGSFPDAADRPTGKRNCRASPNEFFGRFPGLPSDILGH